MIPKKDWLSKWYFDETTFPFPVEIMDYSLSTNASGRSKSPALLRKQMRRLENSGE